MFKHFVRAEIKLPAESYPGLPFSLFEDRHWLSLHELSKFQAYYTHSSATWVSNSSS